MEYWSVGEAHSPQSAIPESPMYTSRLSIGLCHLYGCSIRSLHPARPEAQPKGTPHRPLRFCLSLPSPFAPMPLRGFLLPVRPHRLLLYSWYVLRLLQRLQFFLCDGFQESLRILSRHGVGPRRLR